MDAKVLKRDPEKCDYCLDDQTTVVAITTKDKRWSRICWTCLNVAAATWRREMIPSGATPPPEPEPPGSKT